MTRSIGSPVAKRRRERRIRVAIVLAVAVHLLAAPPAEAQLEAIGEFPAERFALAVDRQGVLDVDWAEVPQHLGWDLTLWLGQVDDPAVLYTDESGERSRAGAPLASRLSLDLALAVALWDRLQLAARAPLILAQESGEIAGGAVADISGAALGDLHVMAKYQALRLDRHGVDLAVVPVLTLPTGGNQAFRGEDGVSFAPYVAISRAYGPYRMAGNLGYRLRKNIDTTELALGDELFARIGLGHRWRERGGPPVEVDVSLSVATPAGQPVGAFNQNHIELLAGASYDFQQRIAGVVAAGVGLAPGFGTPDWRLVAGVRVSGHRADRDRDGVLDVADACPREAEDRDGFRDDDGCPEFDNDGDGVRDIVDGAPNDPEDRDGFADGDGVPDPDNDDDGVLDAADACPLEAETKNDWQDDDGCPDDVPDTDRDQVADNVDRCVDQPEDADGFEDADGCPDPDNDDDGVLDAADKCPVEAGPADNRGCPDTDRDGDAVVDRKDNCPDEAGKAEFQGCNVEQWIALEGQRLTILKKVYFANNAVLIPPKAYPMLRQVAEVLNNHPEIRRMQVEGHTDNVGAPGYNDVLSQRRAQAVVDYLVKRGVGRERLVPKGFGMRKPLDTNDTPAGRAKNRRVEFVFIEDADSDVLDTTTRD